MVRDAVEMDGLDETTEAEGEPCLTLYRENFERPLIEATKIYYADESQRLCSEVSFFDFTKYVSECSVVVNAV